MGGRYLVTGVQLAMIKVMAKYHEVDKLEENIIEIQDKQYLGDSYNDLTDDILNIKEGKPSLFTK